MSDKTKPETLADADLDDAAGGLKINTKSMMITSVSTGGASDGSPPTVSSNLTYEEIKPKHKTSD
ncbi:MAG: hypothetical protein AAGE80_19045 [Pseudomonadota bacterium]